MECFYINLRHQAARRNFLEHNFSDHKKSGWYLSRVEAVDKEHAASAAGTIRAAEKACFLSHCQALNSACEAPGHALILEDDAMFGPNTCAVIERGLAQLGDDWDLAYVDLGVLDAPLMTQLIHLRRQAESTGDLVVLDAQALVFAGASAYIVNQRSKEKLLELIQVKPLNIQYDLFLRELVVIGKLRGRVIFPFPMTLSSFADDTQIQHQIADSFCRVLNGFRRFIWMDRDLEVAGASLDQLPPNLVDEESALFGRIVSMLVSRNLVPDS
jgi:GR25 family glycosyltransferase involved in LPS biosynthesis